jgi:septin 3/9/12
LNIAGQTGLGKSTLINTIFASHLIDTKGRLAAEDAVRQTTEIEAVSHGELWEKCFGTSS